jgi:hypothetical protein
VNGTIFQESHDSLERRVIGLDVFRPHQRRREARATEIVGQPVAQDIALAAMPS